MNRKDLKTESVEAYLARGGKITVGPKVKRVEQKTTPAIGKASTLWGTGRVAPKMYKAK